MISPTNTVSPEWQNENALRSYPVADDSQGADLIPTWLLSDLRVTVNSDYVSVFVSSVYVSDTIISVGISGAKSTGVAEGLLTKTVTRDELEPDKCYSMDPIVTYVNGVAHENATGVISFGAPPQDAEPMKLTLDAGVAPIVDSAITRVAAPGVTRIIDNVHGEQITGLIDLSGNSEFRTYAETATDGSTVIVVELADMYRDMTTSVCSSAPTFDNCGETPVKTINGVAPNSAGTLTLRFR